MLLFSAGISSRPAQLTFLPLSKPSPSSRMPLLAFHPFFPFLLLSLVPKDLMFLGLIPVCVALTLHPAAGALCPYLVREARRPQASYEKTWENPLDMVTAHSSRSPSVFPYNKSDAQKAKCYLNTLQNNALVNLFTFSLYFTRISIWTPFCLLQSFNCSDCQHIHIRCSIMKWLRIRVLWLDSLNPIYLTSHDPSFLPWNVRLIIYSHHRCVVRLKRDSAFNRRTA